MDNHYEQQMHLVAYHEFSPMSMIGFQNSLYAVYFEVSSVLLDSSYTLNPKPPTFVAHMAMVT